MNAREILIETHPHMPPAAALAAVSAADAARRVPGLPHSIAEIVGHMTYWQDWFTARCEGRPEAAAATAALGWPAVGAADWPALSERFVAGLERLAEVIAARDPDARVTPAIEMALLTSYSFRDVCVHVAQHNAHHLGQVIAQRQILGLWPPPSGSYTW